MVYILNQFFKNPSTNFFPDNNLKLKLSTIIQKYYFYLLLQFCSSDMYIRGSLNKFPYFFRMGTFIGSTHENTHETLLPFEVISLGCNALVVPFQQLLEGPMEVLLCECVNDLCYSLFHLLNCLITTASELRE